MLQAQGGAHVKYGREIFCTSRASAGGARDGLVQAGRTADAERVYREDLERNPGNGWSLFGLAQALRAQGKTADAARAAERFRQAWAQADVTLTASRF